MPQPVVLHIGAHYLALAIAHLGGVGSLAQTLFTSSLPRRAAGDGPGGGLFGNSRVVAFELPARVSAVLLFASPRAKTRYRSCPNIISCYLFRLLFSIFMISTPPHAFSVPNRYV